MNVFDVLREKLEEFKNQLSENEMLSALGVHIVERVVEETQKIVDQVEQEHSDGWIPCSERLPEEDGAYLVTLYSKYYQQFEVDLLSYNKKYGEWNDIVDRDYSDEVIAWKQLPEPFEKV